MAQAHRFSVITLLLTYVVAFLSAATVSFTARPAYHGAVRGLALYSGAGVANPVYVSGQRLSCQPAHIANAPETCSFTIGSDNLVIQATRLEVETALERDCTARFRNATPSCILMMNRGSVPGFAYVGLTELATLQELDKLRRNHWFENLSEDAIVTVVMCFALGAGTLAIYALLPILWRTYKNKLYVLAIAAVTIPGVAWLVAIGSMFVIAGGYWD